MPTADCVYPPSSVLAADQQRAERLLFELASDLRFLPLGDGTRQLHIRALEIKGAVGRWMLDPPGAIAREATCNEIVELQSQTRAVLGRAALRAERPNAAD
jgi:hypothetical protein